MSRRRRPPRRPQRHEHPSIRRRILVVTEGKVTEPDYIERLVRYLDKGSLPVFVQTLGIGKDPLAVVEAAVSRRDSDARKGKAWDKVVGLIDSDQHTTIRYAADLAASEGITLAITRLKFETWLLWHVTDSLRAHTSRELDDLMQHHGLLVNRKAIAPSFPFDGLEQALNQARRADPKIISGRLGPDPSSGMPLLIDILRRS